MSICLDFCSANFNFLSSVVRCCFLILRLNVLDLLKVLGFCFRLRVLAFLFLILFEGQTGRLLSKYSSLELESQVDDGTYDSELELFTSNKMAASSASLNTSFLLGRKLYWRRPVARLFLIL